MKLSDCVHVAEASGDAGCPKDTVPFLLETTDKRYLLAAESSETAGWVLRLCELAFPVSAAGEPPGKGGDPARGKPYGRDNRGEGDPMGWETLWVG